MKRSENIQYLTLILMRCLNCLYIIGGKNVVSSTLGWLNMVDLHSVEREKGG